MSLGEFANDPPEIHASGVGFVLGSATAFIWGQFSQLIAVGLFLFTLTAILGIRFDKLLSATNMGTIEYAKAEKTKLLIQLKNEGHYTLVAYSVGFTSVYVILLVFQPSIDMRQLTGFG